MIKINSAPVSRRTWLDPVGDAATGRAEALLLNPKCPYDGDDHGNPAELLWPQRPIDGRRQRLRLGSGPGCVGGQGSGVGWDMNESFGSAERQQRWRKTALPVQTPAHRRRIVTFPEKSEIIHRFVYSDPAALAGRVAQPD
jgi:hypothetical protein